MYGKSLAVHMFTYLLLPHQEPRKRFIILLLQQNLVVLIARRTQYFISDLIHFFVGSPHFTTYNINNDGFINLQKAKPL